MKKFYVLIILFSLSLLSFPLSSFSQGQFEIFVSSRATNAVKVYDESGNYIKDFIVSGSGGLSLTEDIVFHPDGTVLVTGFNNTAIKRYHGITGAYIGDFSMGYTLDTPSKMSIGPDSLLYVTQWGTAQNKVVRFDLNGNFVDEFTSIGTPNGLGHVWDEDRNFYIALFGQNGSGTVHKFDSAGNNAGVFINTSILQGPTSIWFDGNGDMLVEDWTAGTVLRYDSSGQFINIFLTGMTNPEGITIMPNGDMLIGDWGQDAVHRYDSLGGNLGYFTSGNGLSDPNSIKIRQALGVNIGELRDNISSFNVFPSVSNSHFEIKINIESRSDIAIHILDMNGQLITDLFHGYNSIGEQSFMWTPEHSLASGTYLVNIMSGTSSKTHIIEFIR